MDSVHGFWRREVPTRVGRRDVDVGLERLLVIDEELDEGVAVRVEGA